MFLTIFHFCIFYIFVLFLYFGGRRHEALAFKSAPCPAGTPVRVGSMAVFLKCAEKLMFGCCLVQLTSLTGRLLRLCSTFRRVTLVAWKRYKTRLNRALRLLDASLTLLDVLWSLLGRIWAHFGRPGRLWDAFGVPFWRIIYDIGTEILLLQ